MTGTADPPAEVGPPQVLTDDYEALRKDALAGCGRGHGLALLLREGMAAWIRAWSCAPGPAPGVARPVRAEPGLPAGVRSEVVSVLASMALASGQRAVS